MPSFFDAEGAGIGLVNDFAYSQAKSEPKLLSVLGFRHDDCSFGQKSSIVALTSLKCSISIGLHKRVRKAKRLCLVRS